MQLCRAKVKQRGLQLSQAAGIGNEAAPAVQLCPSGFNRNAGHQMPQRRRDLFARIGNQADKIDRPQLRQRAQVQRRPLRRAGAGIVRHGRGHEKNADRLTSLQ